MASQSLEQPICGKKRRRPRGMLSTSAGVFEEGPPRLTEMTISRDGDYSCPLLLSFRVFAALCCLPAEAPGTWLFRPLRGPAPSLSRIRGAGGLAGSQALYRQMTEASPP